MLIIKNPMLILHDIDSVIFNYLQVREVLTYAILSKKNNQLARETKSYNALIKQLAKNHKCSLGDLTISAINDGNYELLDLLERSDAEPCQYFDSDVYSSLIEKCALKTIIWFDKQMGLHLNMDDITTRIIFSACGNESYIQVIQNHYLFIFNRPDEICKYIRHAYISNNIRALDWFYEKYSKQTNEYFNSIMESSDYGKISPHGYDKLVVRWLFEHNYLDLKLIVKWSSFDEDRLYRIKIVIIEDSVLTNIYGSIPIDILHSNPNFINKFVTDSALINKYEGNLLHFRSEIEKNMHDIICTIIEKNDIYAFNWIIHKFDIIRFNKNHIMQAFKYGCTAVIQYLVDHKYQIGRPYNFLYVVASLHESRICPVLELFEQMLRTEINRRDIIELVYRAIRIGSPNFLEWLFKYFKITQNYFTANQLNKIFLHLAEYKDVDIIQFFVDHGYDVCIVCYLSSINKDDGDFLKYILTHPTIKKEFKAGSPITTTIKIFSTKDLQLLQWYVSTYNSNFDTDFIKRILNHIIVYDTEELTIWYLDYIWDYNDGHNNGSEIVRETFVVNLSALIYCRTKILDWLRNKKIAIRHPYELIAYFVTTKKFNMIYYLRKYLGVKIETNYANTTGIYDQATSDLIISIYISDLVEKNRSNCFDYSMFDDNLGEYKT